MVMVNGESGRIRPLVEINTEPVERNILAESSLEKLLSMIYGFKSTRKVEPGSDNRIYDLKKRQMEIDLQVAREDRLMYWARRMDKAEPEKQEAGYNDLPRRTPYIEAVRRDIQRKISKCDTELERRKFTELLSDWDQVYAKYHDSQSEQCMDHMDLGEIRYRVLGLRWGEAKLKAKRIVLLGSISTDIDPQGLLAMELHLRGFDVDVIGYPEAPMGKVSEKYVKQVEERGIQAHADFFREAVAKQVKDTERFSLWGYSTGGLIAALISNREMSEKVDDLVLLAPAGSIDQSKLLMVGGVIQEGVRVLGQLPKWSFVWGRKKKEDPEQQEMKQKVLMGLVNGISRKSQVWVDLPKVQGKVLIWSGERDKITKTKKSTFTGVRVIRDLKGSHLTPVLEPERVVGEVMEALNN